MKNLISSSAVVDEHLKKETFYILFFIISTYLSDQNLFINMSCPSCVGVVGIGYMGRSIVAAILAHTRSSILCYDNSKTAEKKCREYVKASIEELIKRLPKYSAETSVGWESRLTFVHSLDEFSPCDFVIESVFENFDLKQSVFDEIEAVVGPEVSIASNTSAIPITKLQKPRKVPGRFLGMHMMAPVQVSKFLEVVKGEMTDEVALDPAMQLGKAMGKEPTRVMKDIRGFIINRLAYAVYREAFHLLEEGVGTVEDIDQGFMHTMGQWGSLMGPFRWMDITGVPPYRAVMEDLNKDLSNNSCCPDTMKKIAAQPGGTFHRMEQEEVEKWQAAFQDRLFELRELGDKVNK